VDDLATSCKNLVNFGTVTLELEGQRCTPLVDQQFGYVHLAAPLLDLAGSALSVLGRSILSFV